MERNILLLFLTLVIIGFDIYFECKNMFVIVLIWVLKAPIILFEYFCLFWFWGGDGLFTLIVIPTSFAVFYFLGFLLLKKYREKMRVKKTLTNFLIFITPVLSVAYTYLIAKIIGVKIQIH